MEVANGRGHICGHRESGQRREDALIRQVGLERTVDHERVNKAELWAVVAVAEYGQQALVRESARNSRREGKHTDR